MPKNPREVKVNRDVDLNEIQQAYYEYRELVEANGIMTTLNLLAEKYGVSSRTLRRYFDNVDSDGKLIVQETIIRPSSKYGEDIIRDAFEEYQEGASVTELSRKYDIPKSTLSRQFTRLNGGKKLRGARR